MNKIKLNGGGSYDDDNEGDSAETLTYLLLILCSFPSDYSHSSTHHPLPLLAPHVTGWFMDILSVKMFCPTVEVQIFICIVKNFIFL
jgi:hypothetical protein